MKFTHGEKEELRYMKYSFTCQQRGLEMIQISIKQTCSLYRVSKVNEYTFHIYIAASLLLELDNSHMYSQQDVVTIV